MQMNPSRRRVLMSSAAALIVLAAVPPLHAQVTITQFLIPTPNSRPYTIVTGPDGALWFTESNGNKVGRITTTGLITEFPVPTPGSGPYGIAVGIDGNIWFTERFADIIARISPSTHLISEFPVLTAFAQPWDIAPGADGNLWFTEEDVHQVGRITPLGGVTEYFTDQCCFPTHIAPGVDGNVWYTIEIGDWIARIEPTGQTTTFPVSQNQVLLWDIQPGPDGNVWFSELAGRAIGRITTAGTVVEYPIPGPFSGIAGITTGWDGNIWYTENDTDHVGAIDVNGNLLPIYNTGSRPLSITPGPDGNLWFTIADGNAIGRVNVASANTSYALSMDAGFSPPRRVSKLGNPVKWMFMGPRPHSVVDATGLNLFDSGPKTMVSFYTRPFTAAGSWRYKDGVTASTPMGWINVPVTLPASGMVNQPFLVTWATAGQGPKAVFDVQVDIPGSSGFVLWQTTAALSGNYTPAIPGTYRFRARMRNLVTGAMNEYSPPASIPVQ